MEQLFRAVLLWAISTAVLLLGASNDGFLLYKCFKICVCSVILGELESLRNHKGLSISFPKIFDAI